MRDAVDCDPVFPEFSAGLGQVAAQRSRSRPSANSVKLTCFVCVIRLFVDYDSSSCGHLVRIAGCALWDERKVAPGHTGSERRQSETRQQRLAAGACSMKAAALALRFFFRTGSAFYAASPRHRLALMVENEPDCLIVMFR